MLQHPAESNEDDEHGRYVEKCHWGRRPPEDDGEEEDDDRVRVGDGGGEHDEHVHVGIAVFDGFPGGRVEVTTSEDLNRGAQDEQEEVVQGEGWGEDGRLTFGSHRGVEDPVEDDHDDHDGHSAD